MLACIDVCYDVIHSQNWIKLLMHCVHGILCCTIGTFHLGLLTLILPGLFCFVWNIASQEGGGGRKSVCGGHMLVHEQLLDHSRLILMNKFDEKTIKVCLIVLCEKIYQFDLHIFKLSHFHIVFFSFFLWKSLKACCPLDSTPQFILRWRNCAQSYSYIQKEQWFYKEEMNKEQWLVVNFHMIYISVMYFNIYIIFSIQTINFYPHEVRTMSAMLIADMITIFIVSNKVRS